MRKHPSPTTATTGLSGRTSFAAYAAGIPKPIDDQPFVEMHVPGTSVRH
jgi:hypothetical protein